MPESDCLGDGFWLCQRFSGRHGPPGPPLGDGRPYPGSGTAAPPSTSITPGAATGAATPIAIGDLVLMIQTQDAAINSTNTGAW